MKLVKIVLFWQTALALLAAEQGSLNPTAPVPAPTGTNGSLAYARDLTLVERHRAGSVRLVPGPDDGKIARVVSTILRQSHYSQLPFDAEMASKFLDRYLDALDPAHLLFLQADLDEFNRWRNTLDDMTLRLGDITPGLAIFNRFLARYEQHVNYMVGPAMFTQEDIKSLPSLASKLKQSQDKVSQYLTSRFSEPTLKTLADFTAAGAEAVALEKALLKEFNEIIQGQPIYEKQRFAGVELSEACRKLIEENPQGEMLVRLNRQLLEEAYAAELAKSPGLLLTEKFAFDGNDRYLLNRRDQPRPRNLEEARQVWRERIRYEYLTEKLNMGRPQEVAQAVLEKLQKKKAEDILASIRASREKKEKLKKEKEAATSTAPGTNENSTVKPETKVYNDITSALKGKLGDEKADQIADLVEKRLTKEAPEEIAKAIAAKMERENADEIVKIITRRYLRQWRMLKEFDSDDVLQIYLTSLARAYDPHSEYMAKPSADNFNISMKLSLFGIGALLRSEDGYVRIEQLMPGPAMKSKKMKPNDKIIAVAQGTNEPVYVVDMKLNKVVELIRGPKDTEVRLTIIPADAADQSTRKVVSLIRDEIKLEDQEAKAKIIEITEHVQGDIITNRLGIIDLPSFYADLNSRKAGRKSTTTDVGRLLAKLKQENVKGVVLDLRRNGGGALEEAINLTGLFITNGPVVQVRDFDGRVTVDSDNDPEIAYDGPLVVLTSRFSASASEILAAALQDYGRALVVGDISTHGKGTVQSLLELKPVVRPISTNELGSLKYTIRKFYRINGSSTQLKGVTPDIVLPSVNNYADVGESALTNALAWDTIRKADYEAVNLIAPCLDELRKRSADRLEKDKDFAFLRQEIERYKKTKDDKTVSMNEAERIKEKKDNEARAEARKKELKNRSELEFKTYDITLKLVDQPGLPPPTVRTNGVASKEAKPTGHPVDPSLDEEEKDDTTPAPDITLEETKRILLDLIALSEKSKGLAHTAK
ncbi:MAG: carboxy terminal-processing peptidase [Verrucomicrobia bacterium]|nr:carboxy terminal-processing peptidase [Verrucomicrobiota bacterium]